MNNFHLYNLGKIEYSVAFSHQKQFVKQRHPDTVDEVWCLEHPPVYTLGLSGKTEHIIDRGNIPIVQTDRGGQVTYHGPGQLVVYPLLDLKRRKISVKNYVRLLEQAIMDTLNEFDVSARRIQGAPGVYVDDRKIAALGIRMRKGCCYHGISLNVDMDLSPYDGINPCGYEGLAVTQLKDLGVDTNISSIMPVLATALANQLGYEKYIPIDVATVGKKVI